MVEQPLIQLIQREKASMAQPEHRRVTVAIPASLTKDVPHLREKTAKIGLIGRTLAIFRVDRIVIYQDEPRGSQGEYDARLLEKILRFQETPQYLRRHLFKMDPDLQFTGTLPPLRTPHHPNRMDPEIGQTREGIVVSSTSRTSSVEAGYKQQVDLKTKRSISERVTLRITKTKPELEGELVDPAGLRIYWGFRVQREDLPLAELVKKGDHDMTLSTSRKGQDVREVLPALQHKWQTSYSPLILFGSPSRGIPEILADTGTRVEDVADFNLNTIPHQGVETVRTEEALMASLAILNLLDAWRHD